MAQTRTGPAVLLVPQRTGEASDLAGLELPHHKPSPAAGQDDHFDYTTLDGITAAFARRAAQQIKAGRRQTIDLIIQTGATLNEVKAKLGRGFFGSWRRAEFGMDERTAQRYMTAATVFENKSNTVSHLQPTTVFAIAAKSTPAALRNEVIAAGNDLGDAAIKEKIAEARYVARVARAEAKLSNKLKAQRNRRRVRNQQDEEATRVYWEAERAAEHAAGERAAEWVAERGDPAELLALIGTDAAWCEFTAALRRLVQS